MEHLEAKHPKEKDEESKRNEGLCHDWSEGDRAVIRHS